MRISDWSSDVCSSDLFYLVRSLDTHFWEAVLESRGEFINAAFRPELHPEPAEHMALHRLSDGRFVGAIIWRSIVTEDYRSDEHTSELQSLMRISYAVFCLKKKKTTPTAHLQPYNNTHSLHP